MQCRIFVGDTPAKVADSFNVWAKEKSLAKDMIIHTVKVLDPETGIRSIIIIVYFDEKIHPGW